MSVEHSKGIGVIIDIVKGRPVLDGLTLDKVKWLKQARYCLDGTIPLK